MANVNWTLIAWILAGGYVLGQVAIGVRQVMRVKVHADAVVDVWRKAFAAGYAKAQAEASTPSATTEEPSRGV